MNGSRPGPASKLSPLTEYCRQRLADDPHLRNLDLLKEITGLGYHGALTTFAGSLNSHRLTRPRCAPCEASPARAITGMRITCPVIPDGPLPIPARPLAGEMLASYLGRLAAANHLHLLTLLAIMPRWLTGKITSHRARMPGSELLPAAAQSLHQLAALTGAPATAIARALPVFGGGPQGPARAIAACRRCAAARGVTQPVPVYQPACGMICTRHGIWLAGPASLSSTSPPAPRSSSPSTTPAGSCVTTRPSSSYAPASRPPRSSSAHPGPPEKPSAAGSSAPGFSGQRTPA